MPYLRWYYIYLYTITHNGMYFIITSIFGIGLVFVTRETKQKKIHIEKDSFFYIYSIPWLRII